jgi:phospholipase/carboxylesterase/glyoxalase family protein
VNLGFTHRFVPARAAGLPVLVLLHGTGGNENDLLDLGESLVPGAALLSPRGNVRENGMPRFFRRLAEGVFDLEDLRHRTGELADFISAAGSEYRFDLARVVAVGYSNGANIAASLLLLRPMALSAAILFHAMVPLVPDPLPSLEATPVFLTAGKIDTMIPPAEAERLARLLESAGADVTLAWQPGGHRLAPAETEAARVWLNRVL